MSSKPRKARVSRKSKRSLRKKIKAASLLPYFCGDKDAIQLPTPKKHRLSQKKRRLTNDNQSDFNTPLKPNVQKAKGYSMFIYVI